MLLYTLGGQAIATIRATPQDPLAPTAYGCWVTMLIFLVRLQFEEGVFYGSIGASLPFWLTFMILYQAAHIVKGKADSTYNVDSGIS